MVTSPTTVIRARSGRNHWACALRKASG
jgi:hypothetical protein